jgi:hypothetical protein
VGKRGAGLKRGEDVRRWPEIVRSWACPRRGSWAEGWGRADKWGRRDRERASTRVKGTTPTNLAHGAARERGREGAQVGADKPGPWGSERERRTGWRRQVGPACQAPRERGRGAGLNGPTWGELAFLFSREFLLAFIFIFSRVFNSNSNLVSNSNQIKDVQQFKEYLELNMMQHFMTHLFCQK